MPVATMTAPSQSAGAPTGAAAPGGPLPVGVTDKQIKIGTFSGDYATIGAACPRCANGDPEAPVNALLAAWRKALERSRSIP